MQRNIQEKWVWGEITHKNSSLLDLCWGCSSKSKKIQDVGLWVSKMRPTDRSLGFSKGGLKGNDQKKYTLEVKTMKARKSDGLV